MLQMKQTVFITGGTGYIGSHCIVELLNEGYDVITIDNLTNSRSSTLTRVEEIAGKSVTFYQCDLLDGKAINQIFEKVSSTLNHLNGCLNTIFCIKHLLKISHFAHLMRKHNKFDYVL